MATKKKHPIKESGRLGKVNGTEELRILSIDYYNFCTHVFFSAFVC